MDGMSAPDLVSNLKNVRELVARAAAKSQRPADSVRLIAVSKTKPIEMIQEAVRAGQRSFAENYVQELVEKSTVLPTADWHFIGSLQTNKADKVVGHCDLIHSVDRIKLAEKLNAVALQKGKVQDVLIQVRIGDEVTKHGVTLNDSEASFEALFTSVASSQGLRVCGLMTIPPLTSDESTGRGYFSELREVFLRWKTQLPSSQRSHFQHLSMGTSSDFEWAILEGATMVRIGTAIFGGRDSSQAGSLKIEPD
jgi:pyridoxal phosphate enzyme (YggS family)